MFECIGLVSARALALHQFQRSAVIGGTVCLLAPLIIYIWPGVGTLGRSHQTQNTRSGQIFPLYCNTFLMKSLSFLYQSNSKFELFMVCYKKAVKIQLQEYS